MTTSRAPSGESLEITTSPSECAAKLEALRNGALDFNSISLREWIEISYMALFTSSELHLDMKVIEGGNLVHLHTCVQAIVPPAETANLGNKV